MVNFQKRAKSMREEDFDKLSEPVRLAILSDVSQWTLENQGRFHKARSNLMIIVAVSTIISMAGVLPSGIENFGIEFDSIPKFFIYAFIIIINIYSYWTYESYRRTHRIARGFLDEIYRKAIGFDHNGELKKRASQTSKSFYRLWNSVFPLIACLIAVISCLVRISIELGSLSA